jgi:hypothetical protein
MKTFFFVLLMCAIGLFYGCSAFIMGPFIPENDTPCRYDADCPDGTQCRFPARDHAPVCMPGYYPSDPSRP